jgi:hypothetical protein
LKRTTILPGLGHKNANYLSTDASMDSSNKLIRPKKGSPWLYRRVFAIMNPLNKD